MKWDKCASRCGLFQGTGITALACRISVRIANNQA